ncbi:alpha/beta hydrolase [Bacillus sp. FJAT-18017]|uniref:alpha/beta fold hydrolase n=1 Tax=Bacillus sp. FJAT-18017 TaxID=1705566 RepID=UPI0006AE8758|nr:alpha/beta hydrolase [Bacillus sp. FJAT-18017]ALC90617.1 alpha/beta hydrolase [Bacillus sp. FJAT-18017]
MFKHGKVSNNGTYIHFIDSGSKETNDGVPLIIVPGLSESAEDYILLMESLQSLRCITITLRGRGHSDAPSEGYTLEDHISDIESVIKHLHINDVLLMGYSRGVSYALGYALTNVTALKGLVLGDYPAIHSQLPEGWVEYFTAQPPWRGKSIGDRMNRQTLQGIQIESHFVSFWDKLYTIQCPVLIIRGGKEGAALSEENAGRYLNELDNAKLVVFEDSNHNIFEPQSDRFVVTVENFLASIEENKVE